MNRVAMACIMCLFARVDLANAWYDSATFAAKVRAFDAQDVIVEQDMHLYKVPREALIEKDLKAGDAVTVHLHPDELHMLPETESHPKLSPVPPLPKPKEK